MKNLFKLKLKRKSLFIKNTFVVLLVILITISPNIAVWFGLENGPFVKEASAQQVELLTTSGTWTAPANVYEVTVEAWGAGGGAGGPNNKVYSPGGGGGAYSSATLSVTPSSNYSYTIGTGGAGGNNGTSGIAGGDTYWVNTSTVLAKGGAGGGPGTGAGAGGSSTLGVGTTKYSGGNGGEPTASSGGGGGGGAGSTGAGGNASGATAGTGTADNGGNGGSGTGVTTTGNPGSIYGGGGGGTYRSGAPTTGGSGANGLIRITYTPDLIITVGTTGTQKTTVNPSTSNFYIGGAFTFVRNADSASVTSITIAETGTISDTNISGLILYYKQEATCSTSIPVDATQFNSTAGTFSGGSSTVTGSMTVGTSQICMYVEADIGTASEDDTIEIQITNPSTDVTASAGTVSPSTAVAISGTTTVATNQAPTFTSFDDDGPKDPGTNITFTATASDPDADNVFLVVCETQGVTGTSCTGTTLCTSTAVASNPSCQYTIPSVIASGSYNAYPYVFDSNNEPSVSALQGTLSTYSVNNVAPTISAVTINGGAAIDLSAGTTKSVTLTGTISDNNSCQDISSVLGYVYRSAIAYSGCDTAGEANNNFCYPEVSCSITGGTCESATDGSADYTCTVDLQYYTDPTDSNTQYPDDTWLTTIKATDNSSATGSTEVTQGVEMNSLMAFTISTEINYGSLGIGESNDPLDRITTVTPTGNIGLDHEVSGPANMCTDFPTCAGGTIAIGYQKYALSASTSYDSSTSLTTSDVPVYTNVPKPTSGTPTTKNIWWGMLVPEGTSAGTYDGNINIVGFKSDPLNW
jgi:hypothetical protein